MKTPFETLQKHLSIEDTKEFRDKHLPEILDAMEAYAKEYHASQSPAVAEVKELPDNDRIFNHSEDKEHQEKLSQNERFAWRVGAKWMRSIASPIISSLKSENERLKAELEGKEDRAVEFGEWLLEKGVMEAGGGLWEMTDKKLLKDFYTTTQLHEIFLKETSSNGEGKE